MVARAMGQKKSSLDPRYQNHRPKNFSSQVLVNFLFPQNDKSTRTTKARNIQTTPLDSLAFKTWS